MVAAGQLKRLTDGRWQLAAAAPQASKQPAPNSKRNGSKRPTALEVVRTMARERHPQAFTRSEGMAAITSKTKLQANGIDAALHRLRNDGEITNVSKGIYQWVPPKD
jgi:hypothetical protein